MLSGNGRAAQIIGASGAAVTGTAFVIAGLKGIGPMAGINPFLAGLAVAAILTTLAVSCKSQKGNPHKMTMESIQGFSGRTDKSGRFLNYS